MITADDVYTLFRPSRCRRRVYLNANRPDLAAPPSEYDLLVMERGREHEQAHLATLPEAVSPVYPIGDLPAGASATRTLIEQGLPVIYQGVVCSPSAGIGGVPDFLIRKGNSYLIRDAKLAINLENHPEIPAQLSLYAKAFETTIGFPSVGLEVVLGDRTVPNVPVIHVEEIVEEIVALKQAAQEPDEAVGWSKCTECAFFQYCWPEAEKRFDPAIVFGVDQGLRNALIEAGIVTYHKLVKMPLGRLAELRRPWGKSQRRVGIESAEKILRQARALISGTHEVFAVPELPPPGPCIYFDIESDPHDEALENKVYLWGVLTDLGDDFEPEYWGTLSKEGEEGDKKGWFEFLNHAKNLLNELGDVPFVHYWHYEKTWVRKYIDRCGDPGKVGERVLGLLWDMQKRAIQSAICLPLPSYSLKLVEQYAGFERSQEDYGGLWSIVRYNEWVKADSEEDRRRIAEELLRYNREDCEAMRRVLDWARQLT